MLLFLIVTFYLVEAFKFPPHHFLSLLPSLQARQGTALASTNDVSFLSSFTSDMFFSNLEEKIFKSETQGRLWKRGEDLLTALTNPKIELLNHNITAISINSPNADLLPCAVCPNVLYERWWYERLFTAMFQIPTSRSEVLIGSEGTSKSTFQFWLIYRLLQWMHNGK